MTSNSAELNLISDIYDAAIDTELWEPLLDRLCPYVGAKGGALLGLNMLDLHQYTLNCVSSIYSKHDMQMYRDNYSKYEENHLRLAAESPVGSVVLDTDFTDNAAKLVNRPDIKYLRENFGIYERFGIRLNDDGSWFDAVAFQYDQSRGNVTEEEAQRLQMFVPHMAQAMVLSRSFSLLKSHFNAVLNMLDHITVGLYLVHQNGSIILANQTGQELLDQRNGVRKSARGKLTVSTPHQQTTLDQAIQTASATAQAQGREKTVTMAVSKPSGHDNYYVEVSALKDTNHELDGVFKGAIVSVIDPDRSEPINIQGMQQIYGLTAAELSVASLFLEGLSNAEIAETRGVGNDTIKSQIQSILTKTRSRNRTEMVRRALRINLPFRR